jgi:tetratricopeptide (TPR) repeat protein
LSTEAVTLGQALGVSTGQLGGLLLTRGLYLRVDGRYAQSVAYYREAARLATQAGDNLALGRALFNLSDALAATDPAAAVEAGRAAAGHLRRTGARDHLAAAIINLAQALLMLGDWDAAEAELIEAAEADGLADIEFLPSYRGWLAALRGDTITAQTMLATLADFRASETLLDKARVSTVEAFTAAARGQPQEALRLARGTLAHADALGISDEYLRWAWPLAARAAHELGDVAATAELLTLIDAYQPGQLAPMQRAERDLARARLAASEGDPAAAASFTAAIGGLREMSTPYHLAYGLLDHAQFLIRSHDAQAAEAAIGEARDIARNLQCQSLLDRAAHITAAKSPAQA